MKPSLSPMKPPVYHILPQKNIGFTVDHQRWMARPWELAAMGQLVR